MRKPKRNSSADSLNEEQASILSHKQRKTDNSETPVTKRRTSQKQRSSNRSRQPKMKANEKSVGKKKDLAENDPEEDTQTNDLQILPQDSMTDFKKEASHFAKELSTKAETSSNGSRQPKTKVNVKNVGKQKVLVEKDLEKDAQAKNMQVWPQNSMTDINKEVRRFITVLHGKKQELEKGDDSKSKLILLSASKTESASNTKGGNGTSGSTKGTKTVPPKATDSDPKFKLVRELMYS